MAGSIGRLLGSLGAVLVLRGAKAIGAARLASSLVFARGVWMNVVVRSGLTLDTRLVPATKGAPRPGACLYLMHRGAFVLDGDHGPRFEGPAAFLLSEQQLEGALGVRSETFRAYGAPFAAIEMHLAEADVLSQRAEPPSNLEVDDASLAAVARVIGLAQEASGDTRELEAAIGELLRALADARVIAARVAESAHSPVRLERLWRAARPLAERFALTATMNELGAVADVSPRQLDRYLQDFFGTFAMVGGGWRAATVHLRIKLAIMFLSAEGVSVTEVARAVGYGSSDAMARAFRDAGAVRPDDAPRSSPGVRLSVRADTFRHRRDAGGPV